MFVRRMLVGSVAAVLLVGGACGSDEATESPETTAAPVVETTAAPTTTEAPEVLRVLVSNDDGVGAEGIDVLVEALRALPHTEVTVIAPRDQQSGQGGKTTDGALEVTDATTRSGYPAKAVAGFPADTIIWALDQGGIAERPHVVVTGINEGSNVGPLVNISGTVGAARAAAQRGIAALASSQGLGDELDYPAAAEYVLDWVAEHRDALLAGTDPVQVTSLNVPSCDTGEIRGVVEVPTAADAAGRDVLRSNCASTSAEPIDDVDGFGNGYATFSLVSTTP